MFENLRDIDNYGLDPAWYFTSPGLAWDAALTTLGVELELLSDYDMLLMINLQATKLFIVTPATKGWVVTTPGLCVRFTILYRVIQPLIQHCLRRKMVYLNVIYAIATRNYELFTPAMFRN